MQNPASESSKSFPSSEVLKPLDESLKDKQFLGEHEEKIATFLPEEYHACAKPVKPGSMGSAKLIFDDEGLVAWGEIWTSFCGLAMGGGPPHRGKWLGPTMPMNEDSEIQKTAISGEEIRRGIRLTTGLRTLSGPKPGWITVCTEDEALAAWLSRAIIAENVMAVPTHDHLHLPCGPDFQVAREIKNVIVAMSKCYHYWTGHLTGCQKKAIRLMFCGSSSDGLPIEPDPFPGEPLATELVSWRQSLRESIPIALNLPPGPERYEDWVGVICRNEGQAGELVRSSIAENMIARREKEILFFPVGAVPCEIRTFKAILEGLVRIRNYWRSFTPG